MEEESYYSYEEEYSDLMEKDCSQMFHDVQLSGKSFSAPAELPPSPPPEVCPDDNSILFSRSIRQTKELLEKNLGFSTKKLKTEHPQGLVILPLECFNCIRQTSGGGEGGSSAGAEKDFPDSWTS